MVIGKPQWFARRKYGGWGLQPKTWQGWVYIAIIIIPFIAIQAIPIWDITTRYIITGIWGLFLVIDTFDIMIHLKLDERERMHEAIAERNALWVMMIVVTIGIAYQIASNAIIEQTFYVDPILLIAIFGALITKAISNYTLDKKN